MAPLRRQLVAGRLQSAADIRRLADSGELEACSAVGSDDLQAACQAIQPSVEAAQLSRFENWNREFAST